MTASGEWTGAGLPLFLDEDRLALGAVLAVTAV